MISKAQIKNIKLLHSKKGREEQGLFIAEGPKVVNDLLDSPFNAVAVYAVKGTKVKGEVVEVTEKVLASISALNTPNQVLGVFEIPVHPPFKSLSNLQELVLALDDIRDPGNLGTIIRIADWFGIKYVLCSPTCVEVYNPKVVQAAMGSLGRVQVRYAELDKLLKGYPAVFGAVLNGKNIYKEKLPAQGVLLIGNESNGIGEALLKQITVKLSIPGFSKGADSLNAAVATAILCSEFRRR